MREVLEKLIAEHGYQAVLNDVCVIAAHKITPSNVGYHVVWDVADKLSRLFYLLDRK